MIMKTRTNNRRVWQKTEGYKLGVTLVMAMVTLFFLLVTIMPIILFQTLEDASWEFKTFATSYRPLVALIGLVLFLATGWVFLRIVRGEQILARTRRRTTKPALQTTNPEEGRQNGWGLRRFLRSLPLPWRRQDAQTSAESVAQPDTSMQQSAAAIRSIATPRKLDGSNQ
jgi:hypothetical protein